MTRLPLPVGDALRDGFTEVDVQRVWRGIQARGAAATARDRARRWTVPVAVLAAAAALLLFLSPRAARDSGPLRLAGGGEPQVLLGPATVAEQTVELTDGSRIVLAAGTTLDVLSNEPGSFLTALRRGRSRFDVRPDPDRRWVIECGLATVEVVGTAFTVDRRPDRLEVAVERGTVLVRGDRVPDQVQRLSAGERLVIEAPRGSSAPAAPAHPVPAASTPASEASPDGATSAPRRAGTRAGDPIDELVRRADAARSRGDVALAAELLERAVSEAPPGDPRRALAALTLARLDGSRAPDRASRALDRALSDAPSGLQEDVLARLVEARARAGDREGARRAAAEYELRFPAGARLAEVRRWTAE